MKLVTQTPKKALKAFLKQKPLRSEIDLFKTNLIILLDKISLIDKRPKDESEEHLKNDLRDFLRDTYYRDTHAINTKDKKDLVIHLGKSIDSEVGVIVEAKRPTNINEMITADNPNKKALHELILYYLDERIQAGNNQLKQLVVTNVHEWYIIDANHFDKHIYRNTQIKKLYETKLNDKKDNPFFYEEIAKIVSNIEVDIPCVYFDIMQYNTILRNNKKEDDHELIALHKILSPQHLMKLVTPNDSNSLNEKFYKELLHLIGLEEVKENGKNIIRRKKENRNVASLIEATMEALHTEDVLHRLPDQSIYGETKEERIFNVSLELCITWINRILFLKLLEGQLITYHQGNKDYRFLNTATIYDFDELFKLFHKVLAVNLEDRSEVAKAKYSHVPYLNSSLFEISELEDQTIKINSLDNGGQLELIGTTILKDIKKKVDKLPTLDYLFQFLDAYDFASEGSEEVQEDNKTIINASVLGKVFEKINGYKDGSVFTPAFITMYMCRQSIRLAVVQKFKEVKHWDIENFEDLYNKIEDRKEASDIINTLKICDPAVGSGHFLVSALNEIIAIKSELKVLLDENNKRLWEYDVEIVNDELIITDEDGNIFAYNPKGKESNRVQKTLFHEKQTIIENCLFGVDINPNSVKICRLRLWIELLKSAYYKEATNFTELETLPNIDINIKCGNSLLSRFALDADLKKALKSIKYDMQAYRGFVNEYKNEKSREVKRGLQKIIDGIKNDFRTEINNNDPKKTRLAKLAYELYNRFTGNMLFEPELPYGNKKEKDLAKKRKAEQCKIENEIEKLKAEIDAIKSNAIYKNAFEWRFEFPEVLNNEGDFEGFDVVIGNPPYVLSRETFTESLKEYFTNNYKLIHEKPNLYLLFIERALKILKPFGQFGFIVPNSLTGIESAYKVRELLINEFQIQSIINLLGETFKNIGVESCILMVSKKSTQNKIKYLSISTGEITEKKLNEIDPNIWRQNRNYLFDISSSNNDSFIIEKIKLKSQLLSLQYDVKVGLQAYETGKGKPQQTAEDVKKHIYDFNYKFDSYTYPYLGGADIGRYKLNWSGQWLRYGEWLSQPKTIEQFSRSRILIREITGKFPFVIQGMIIHDTYLNNKSILNILPKNDDYDLSFLLAYLNSTLVSFYHKRQTVKGNRNLFPKIVIKDLQNYPIPTIQLKNQQPFIALVNQILEAKQHGQDTSDLERQIDELVYELYDITPEERKIIEGQ